MAQEIIHFREWCFEVDKNLTKEQYYKIKLGCSETCTCDDCQTFSSLKPIVYPEEILILFNQLGIDVNKENELWTILTLKQDGYYLFSGWYMFVGNILDGQDCHVSTSENTWSVQLLSLNSKFKIGFTSHITKSDFDEDISNLVQVEFEIKYGPLPFWNNIE